MSKKLACNHALIRTSYGRTQRHTPHTQHPHSILLDLTYLRAEVAPCFPPTYDIMETFRAQYERHLVQNIGKLYKTQRGFPGMDQGELLQLMEWLDYYNQEVCACVCVVLKKREGRPLVIQIE